MSKIGSCVFTNVHDYESALSGLEFKLVMSPVAEFSARLSWIELSIFRVFCLEETLARVALICPEQAYWLVAFPCSLDSPLIWDGYKLRTDEFLLCPAGERLHQTSERKSCSALLMFEKSTMSHQFKDFVGAEFEWPTTVQVIRTAPPAATRLRRLHVKLSRLAKTSPEVAAHKEVARALEQDILCALGDCLIAGRFNETSVENALKAAVINQLDKVLIRSPGQRFRIRDLCLTLNVSERHLRNCSADVLGMKPSEYIREWRLSSQN